jgi:hypothetical protein
MPYRITLRSRTDARITGWYDGSHRPGAGMPQAKTPARPKRQGSAGRDRAGWCSCYRRRHTANPKCARCAHPQFAGSDFLGANNQKSYLCDDPARRRFAIALAMQNLGAEGVKMCRSQGV